jgi:polysaccharide biosynthesis/export protein
MLNRLAPALFGITLAGFLPACGLCPGTGPTSDAVNGYATAGIRSTASLPYALVDISSDTIGFLSHPNLITLAGTFPDKRAKPTQVVGVGDILNISIFEAAPGGLFTPGTSAGARPGNFVDCRSTGVESKHIRI